MVLSLFEKRNQDIDVSLTNILPVELFTSALLVVLAVELDQSPACSTALTYFYVDLIILEAKVSKKIDDLGLGAIVGQST